MSLLARIRSWLGADRLKQAEDQAYASREEREELSRSPEDATADARTAAHFGDDASMDDVERLGEDR